MAAQGRQYELILLGATGYTGKYCAEHIVTNLSTDLRWAVAGRTKSKLSTLVEQIKPLNPDRLQPGLEVSSLNPDDLDALAKKTKLLVTTVGPYHLYGTPVVEACARNGTHYIDTTGESPWVLDIIRKYHDTAKANNAIMIPQCGLESAPSDMVTWSLVQLVREKLSAGVKDVVGSVHTLQSLPSGGTLATLFSLFEYYPIRKITESTKPYALSMVRGGKPVSEPLMTRLFGVRYVPDLGTVTTGIAAGPNTTLVNRSWSLYDGGTTYGPNFRYKEYGSARNAFTGFMIHLALALGVVALTIPPFRWLVRKLVHQPGEGPTRESTTKDRIEYRAIATADNKESQRALATFRYDGSAYDLTGVLMAEAAITILRDSTPAHKMGGGILTPATLGQAYIDRLRKARVMFNAHMLSN